MSFTTPCFIRKNTPELRTKLKELGYIQVKQDIYYYHIMVENGNIWICNGAFNPDNPDGKGWDECIDCEDNEALFLALAALRDDSMFMQLFVYRKDTMLHKKGDIFYCYHGGNKFMKELIANGTIKRLTPTEIIAHFKNNM